jgi:FkbM family methyltransferase
MLLDFNQILKKYNMDITGIIHIGAHYGDEVIDNYIVNGITDIILFEPVSRTFDILEDRMKDLNANISAYQVALGSEKGKASININTNNDGKSSSLLKPKQHLIDHSWVLFDGTEEVEVDTLDSYDTGNANFINIDVQGYELEVFKGSQNTLTKIDYIISEVNRAEMYEQNVLVTDLDNYLSQYGFKRVETFWPTEEYNWGDALYIKEKQ